MRMWRWGDGGLSARRWRAVVAIGVVWLLIGGAIAAMPHGGGMLSGSG
jgi:hypothetical protein